MLRSSHPVTLFAAYLILFGVLTAGDSSHPPLELSEKLCVGLIGGELRTVHPAWNIQNLKEFRTADLAFHEGEPIYHAVEVTFMLGAGPDPAGPVFWELGLFKDGRFVRLATEDEYKMFKKIVPKKN